MSSASTAPFDGGDDLIPIRLDLEVGGVTETDYFTWAPDSAMSPHDFAVQLAADLDLPPSSVASIASSISDQIADASDARLERDAIAASSNDASQSAPLPADVRHVVKLNVRVGRVVVRDQFEWELGCGSPEAFAEGLSADLGLSRDFVAAIAWGVREQLVKAKLSRRRRAPSAALTARTALRAPSAVDAFQPVVECLSLGQREGIEKKEKREARLSKRAREPVVVAVKGRGKRQGFYGRFVG